MYSRSRNICNLYPHLCLETVFPALKLTQNCYRPYNINIFFLKTANLIINWLLSDATCHRTERLPWNMKGQGDKNLSFQTIKWIGENLEIQSRLFKNQFPISYEVGKTWKYTQPQKNISKSKCWIYAWVEKTLVLI